MREYRLVRSRKQVEASCLHRHAALALGARTVREGNAAFGNFVAANGGDTVDLKQVAENCTQRNVQSEQIAWPYCLNEADISLSQIRRGEQTFAMRGLLCKQVRGVHQVLADVLMTPTRG